MCRKVSRIAILYPAVGGCGNFKFAAVRDARNCRHATSGNYTYLEYLNCIMERHPRNGLDLNRLRLVYDLYLYRGQNYRRNPSLIYLVTFFLRIWILEAKMDRAQRHRIRDTRFLNKIVRAQFSQLYPLTADEGVERVIKSSTAQFHRRGLQSLRLSM